MKTLSTHPASVYMSIAKYWSLSWDWHWSGVMAAWMAGPTMNPSDCMEEEMDIWVVRSWV